MFNNKISLLSFLIGVNVVSIISVSSSCSSTTNNKSGTSETKANPENSNIDNSKKSDIDDSKKSDIDNSRSSGIDNSENSDIDNSRSSDVDNSKNSDIDNSRSSDVDNSKNSDIDDSENQQIQENENSEIGSPLKIIKIDSNEYFTDDVISNFKNLIFDKKFARISLPSTAQAISNYLFNYWPQRIVKGFLLGYSITKQPTITEANDEKGTARIQCSLSRGNEVKEIDYIYDEFLTTRQKEINESSEEVKKVLNNNKLEITLRLDSSYKYNIDDYRKKTVKELLMLNFDATSNYDLLSKKILEMDKEGKIEGLDQRVKPFDHYEYDPNSFYSFIYVKNNQGEKSSKIKLIITNFTGSTLKIVKSKLWFYFFELIIWNENDNKKLQSFYPTELTLDTMVRTIYKLWKNMIKIPFSLSPNSNDYLDVIIEFKKIDNPNDSIGSIDISLEMKIERNNQVIDTEEKTLTIYGLKTK